MIRQWISNSISAFPNFLHKIGLIIVLSVGSEAGAAPWTVEGFFLSTDELAELKEKYPQLENAHDLHVLLEYISRKRTFAKLHIIFRNGVWVLQGEIAAEIETVEVKTKTYYLRTNLETITEKYSGRVDSIDNQLKLKQELKEYLALRGFHEAKIDLVMIKDGYKVKYKIEIDKNYPCIISKIKFPFPLPQDFDFASKEGDLCDLKVVRENVEKLSQELREAGYRGSSLGFDGITYGSDQRGVISLTGKLGQKIKYLFLDEDGDQLADFFLEDVNTDSYVMGREALVASLLRNLHNMGYIQATIAEPEITTSETEVTYTYTVAVGEKFTLKSLSFRGINFITTDQALEIADITDLGQKDIRAGISRLSSFYAEQGFWQLQIADPLPIYDVITRTAELIVTINEGQRRLFNYLVVRGNNFFAEFEIREMLDLAENAPLNRKKLGEFEQRLRNAYMQNGFIYVDLKIKIDIPDTESTATRVYLDIKENKRARFGTVRITGLKRTRKTVVERELRFKFGDWYNKEKVAATERALAQLGLFRLVQLYPAHSLSSSRQLEYININVEIREGKAGQISFGPGYSFRRGLRYSIGTAYNNIGGTGRKIRLRLGISEERHQKPVKDQNFLLGKKLSAIYFEPWIFNLPVLGILSLTQKDEADDYHSFKRSAEGTLVYQLFTHGRLSVYYGQKNNRTEGTQEQKTNLITSHSVRIGEAGIRFAFDNRDKISWPTRGSVLDLDLGWARYFLASDLEYFKFQIVNNYFFSFRNDLVFALSLSHTSYSQVRRHGVDILPASERLLIGGSDSVRGFASAHNLGPYVRYYDSDRKHYESEVTGGTQRSLLKFEIRYQFLKDFLAASYFIDSGNTFFTQAEASEYQDFLSAQSPAHKSVLYDNFAYKLSDLLLNPGLLVSKHYVSQGIALNYLSPIGLVNIAYGLPISQPRPAVCATSEYHCLDRRSDHASWYRRGKFHFNVGAKF